MADSSLSLSVFSCAHCGTKTNSPRLWQEKAFCCLGCQTVYTILQQDNLLDVYAFEKTGHPVELIKKEWGHFDDPQFQQKFCKKIDENEWSIDFYLEGVHCVACLWIVEKLPEVLPGIINCRLSLATNVAQICFNPHLISLSKIAQKLASYGMPSHPLAEDGHAKELEKKEIKKDLLRVGVAGAFAGNVMIYSFSLYTGANGLFEELFRWITLGLFAPIFVYSGYPFFRGAWSALKNRHVNMDVPLALGIVLAALAGAFNVMVGQGEIYFDSIAMLIFLLSSARVAVKLAYQKGLGPEALRFFQHNTETLVWENGQWVARLSDLIKKDDLVKVLPQKMIPADGIIMSGRAHLETSLMTGESLPQAKQIGDLALHGMVNLGESFEIKITNTAKEGQLGLMLKELERGWQGKAQIVQKGDRAAERFLAIMIAVSLGFIFYYGLINGNWALGIEKAITLIIVTCPCGLALTPPLVLLRSLKHALSKGIVIKDEQTLEKLSKVEEIFFDKTGTLTMGDFSLINEEVNDSKYRSVTLSLEQHSRHPIAQALVRHFVDLNVPICSEISEIREIPGIGVEGKWQGKKIAIQSHPTQSESANNVVALLVDGNIEASWTLGDRLRPESPSTLSELGKRYHLSLLSGDRPEIVSKMAETLFSSWKLIKGGLSPQGKKAIIKNSPNSLFIGDGHNDALAMTEATVSVAVSGAGLLALKSGQVYLTRSGISQIPDILSLASETMKLIKRNYVISAIYNLVAISLILNGTINALWAAVIMPLSSFTVLISTLWGTPVMRKK